MSPTTTAHRERSLEFAPVTYLLKSFRYVLILLLTTAVAARGAELEGLQRDLAKALKRENAAHAKVIANPGDAAGRQKYEVAQAEVNRALAALAVAEKEAETPPPPPPPDAKAETPAATDDEPRPRRQWPLNWFRSRSAKGEIAPARTGRQRDRLEKMTLWAQERAAATAEAVKDADRQVTELEQAIHELETERIALQEEALKHSTAAARAATGEARMAAIADMRAAEDNAEALQDKIGTKQTAREKALRDAAEKRRQADEARAMLKAYDDALRQSREESAGTR